MLLYNGSVAASLPLTLLGLHWNFFQKDERILAQSNSEAFTKLSSYPDGYNPHKSLIPPRTAGAMRGNPYTEFGITDTGTIYGGITTTSDPGNIDISISTNTPAGELVSTVPAGGAPATFGIDTNAPLLTASIGGDGTATFGMTLNTPILGALGGMTVTATFGMDGTLTSHAIGIMEGSTADQGVTVDNVVNGVWNATLADYLLAGSTGAALSAAGGAGDPWITTLPGAYAPGSAGDIIGNLLTSMGARAVDGAYTQDEVMRLIAAVLAGKVSGAGTGTEVFRDINDTKDRIVATVDVNGNRTAITRDAT